MGRFIGFMIRGGQYLAVEVISEQMLVCRKEVPWMQGPMLFVLPAHPYWKHLKFGVNHN
jgi:hypothetical protein